MSSSENLLGKDKIHAKLYDIEALMGMKSSEASGFVILLNEGPSPPKNKSTKKNKSKKEEDDGSALAFMSLTSGNVIDACFGVVHPSRKDATPARSSAQAAKRLLAECDTTEAFRKIAVKAYCKAFEAAIRHNEEMGKLNCITRCFRAGKIERQTEKDIHAAFVSLVKAVGESTISPA
jgi:hypothetical protein